MSSVYALNQVYQWGHEDLKELGNDGYLVIKCLETICTGVIISKFDQLGTESTYLTEVIGSADSDKKKFFCSN